MRFAKPSWLHSLSLKILLAFVLGVLLSIVLIASIAITVLTVRSDLLFVADLVGRAEELAGALQFDDAGTPVGLDASERGADWMYESLGQEVAYRVLDASGKAVMSSASVEAFWGGAAWPAERGYFKFEHSGMPIHGATVPVEHAAASGSCSSPRAHGLGISCIGISCCRSWPPGSACSASSCSSCSAHARTWSWATRSSRCETWRLPLRRLRRGPFMPGCRSMAFRPRSCRSWRASIACSNGSSAGFASSRSFLRRRRMN
jgi:hypothetical protein